ncbi:MAG: nucleotidyltransferase domain-containing protein [Nanoarchaeota archaeon]
MDALLKKVLERVKPLEVQVHEVEGVVKRLNTALHVANIDAECVIGGSFAKGTFLKNDHDVDMFVRFDVRKYHDLPISDVLEPILNSLFKDVERIHGSRDYFQFVGSHFSTSHGQERKLNSSKMCVPESENDFFFEVIPVLRISEYKEAKNVTDMSPFHVDYVKRKIAKKPFMVDEIRLLKVFCKSVGVYGAESFVQGFSGHVIDLLILHAGSFKALIQEASEWGNSVVIDSEGHHKDPLKALNPSKLVSPLVIVDPIQPDRNAAASVSDKSFEKFKEACRGFLLHPSEEFFILKHIDWEAVVLKHKKEWVLGLDIKPLEGKADVVGTKVLRVFEQLKERLEEHEFKILEDGFEFGEENSILYFVVKKAKLSNTVLHQGPPLKNKEDAQNFKEKHKEAYEEKGRLWVKLKRKYLEPKSLIEHIIQDKYVTERIKGIAWLHHEPIIE